MPMIKKQKDATKDVDASRCRRFLWQERLKSSNNGVKALL
jgi:hypothetical protein